MKVTDKIRKQASELMEKHGLKQIFVNERNEFFSEENNAANSVGRERSKYCEVQFGISETATVTNDLGKVADVVAAIEAAADAEAVETILKAEQQGKNRKGVIESAEKKLAAFAAKLNSTNENSGEGADDTDDGIKKTAETAVDLNDTLKQASESSNTAE